MTLVHLITHSEVEITAPAIEVWPYVLEPNEWKLGLKPVRVAGDADAVGEVRHAQIEHEGVSHSLTTETVALDTLRRKVLKITSGSALDPAWAAWHLRERDGITTVTYDVYGQVEVPAGSEADYLIDNWGRFDEELLALKHLVEKPLATP